jgi:hypothetical protein
MAVGSFTVVNLRFFRIRSLFVLAIFSSLLVIFFLLNFLSAVLDIRIGAAKLEASRLRQATRRNVLEFETAYDLFPCSVPVMIGAFVCCYVAVTDILLFWALVSLVINTCNDGC